MSSIFYENDRHLEELALRRAIHARFRLMLLAIVHNSVADLSLKKLSVEQKKEAEEFLLGQDCLDMLAISGFNVDRAYMKKVVEAEKKKRLNRRRYTKAFLE